MVGGQGFDVLTCVVSYAFKFVNCDFKVEVAI